MQSDVLVPITAKDREIIGDPDPDTRVYRASGSSEDYCGWFEYIDERFHPLVSPGGAAAYVHVSRAGIHKRLKAGKMTAFLYHETHSERTLMGKTRTVKAQPYCYLPVIECKAWATEIALREAGIDKKSEEEIEAFWDQFIGKEKDWDKFLAHDPKDKGRKDVRAENDSLRDTVKFLTDLWRIKPWKKDAEIDRGALKKVIKMSKEKKPRE